MGLGKKKSCVKVAAVTALTCALSLINITSTSEENNCDTSKYLFHHPSIWQRHELKRGTLSGCLKNSYTSIHSNHEEGENNSHLILSGCTHNRFLLTKISFRKNGEFLSREKI